ncbi:putative uncharacterized protein DDB_G0290521 [Anabas testudineus]|uniref:putative uncharacterized protein DDB_G0290521 n=1 Tax=Anabas testudineus TaxID=64144 RepID=UPI000E459302|nr:putative uncharacterized protein DDB_G0290521 [Anabas testudineus]
MNHGERASTLPRTKPKTLCSPALSAKPSISIFPAPNSSPTPSPVPAKPSDSPPASQLTDLSPLLHRPQPKPSVSPTLTVPTPRLSPSPTLLCQGMSSESQGGKQPSPVAKERLARSITISNTQSLSNNIRQDILDQEALLDFTHPALRRSCPMTSKESQNQAQSKSQRQAASSENPRFLEGKSKKDNISKDKQKLTPRNLDFTAIPKPKSHIKQPLELQPSVVTGKQKSLSESEGIKSVNVVHRESQPVFDGFATQSNLKRPSKCTDYLQSRLYSQTTSCAFSHQSYQHANWERSAALPVTPKTSLSAQPLLSQSTVSPNIETKRRLFDLHNEKKVDTAVSPCSTFRRPQEENYSQTVTGQSDLSTAQNIQSRQKLRDWLKAQIRTAQTDVQSSVNQFKCVSEDYSCKSRLIDQKVEASQCSHRLNRLKTCLIMRYFLGKIKPTKE